MEMPHLYPDHIPWLYGLSNFPTFLVSLRQQNYFILDHAYFDPKGNLNSLKTQVRL